MKNPDASLHEFPVGLDILFNEYEIGKLVKDSEEGPDRRHFFNPLKADGNSFWDFRNQKYVQMNHGKLFALICV